MIGAAARDIVMANRTGLAVAACIFAVLVLTLLGRTGGTFQGEVDIVLFPPHGGGSAKIAEAGDQSLIAFASATQLAAGGGAMEDAASYSHAPLYGFGVESGSRATVPSEGGQWLRTFHAAVLHVDAVGSDPETVTHAVEAKTAQVLQFLDERQTAAGVSPEQRVTAIPFPAGPRITHVSAHPVKALAACVTMLGVCLLACRSAADRSRP